MVFKEFIVEFIVYIGNKIYMSPVQIMSHVEYNPRPRVALRRGLSMLSLFFFLINLFIFGCVGSLLHADFL